jgi:hypothetical protein
MPFIINDKEYKTLEEVLDIWKQEQEDFKALHPYRYFIKEVYKFIKGFKDSIRIGYRNLRLSIYNLRRWFKTIWRDRDWDYHYVYVILRRKIQFIKELHENNQHYVGWESNVKQMEIVLELLDRIIEDDYDNAPEIKELWNENPVKAWNEVAKKRKEDIDMMYDYLNKYGEDWWD